MINKFLLVIVFYVSLIHNSCHSQTIVARVINWNDSASVKSYLAKATLCDEIHLVRDSLKVFILERGYSIKVLENISKVTNEFIYIPIATGNVTLTNDSKVKSLNEQINEIEKKYCK